MHLKLWKRIIMLVKLELFELCRKVRLVAACMDEVEAAIRRHIHLFVNEPI